jgi:predicted dehydrogenase
MIHFDSFIGRDIFVGYNLRFHSCVKKAKEWLDADLIGKPLWANFTLGQHSEKPPYLRDGVILNWSHEIDLALYLLGNGNVSGSSTRLSDGKDDIADICLTHENGCRSSIHLDYVTQPEIRQFLIVGTGATIIVDLLHRMAWLRRADEVIMDQFQGQDSWDENYVEEMQAFLDRCDGKDTIGATGEEGLAVLKICLEVRKQAGL